MGFAVPLFRTPCASRRHRGPSIQCLLGYRSPPQTLPDRGSEPSQVRRARTVVQIAARRQRANSRATVGGSPSKIPFMHPTTSHRADCPPSCLSVGDLPEVHEPGLDARASVKLRQRTVLPGSPARDRTAHRLPSARICQNAMNVLCVTARRSRPIAATSSCRRARPLWSSPSCACRPTYLCHPRPSTSHLWRLPPTGRTRCRRPYL